MRMKKSLVALAASMLLLAGVLTLGTANASISTDTYCATGYDTVESFGGADNWVIYTLVSPPEKECVDLGGGDDAVDTGGGEDAVFGGPGDDDIKGGPKADILAGDSGADTIKGNGGADILWEGNRDATEPDGKVDVLNCGMGDDVAYAGAEDTVTNCETVHTLEAAPPPTSPPPTSPPPPPGVFRSFTADSWWNTPIPGSVGLHSSNTTWMNWLNNNATQGIKLAQGDWALPTYFADVSDPLVTINPSGGGPTTTFHLPSDAHGMVGNDGALLVFDLSTNQEVQCFEFVRSPLGCTGIARYYLDSNGIQEDVTHGTPGNDGHRGIPGSSHVVRLDELADGVIAHRLKVAINGTGECHYWPMNNHERGKGGIICEAAVIRIKPSVDLDSRFTPGSPEHVIATALQDYGALVGDNGGGSKMTLKMEEAASYPLANNALWTGLSWSDFEWVQGGWGE
jgi:hypothetical protein